MKKIVLVVMCLILTGAVLAVDDMGGKPSIPKYFNGSISANENVRVYLVTATQDFANLPIGTTIFFERKLKAGKKFNGVWIVRGDITDK